MTLSYAQQALADQLIAAAEDARMESQETFAQALEILAHVPLTNIILSVSFPNNLTLVMEHTTESFFLTFLENSRTYKLLQLKSLIKDAFTKRDLDVEILETSKDPTSLEDLIKE